MPSDIYRSVVVLSTVVAPLGLVGHLYIHTLAVRLYTHLLPTEGATTPYCTHTYCPQRGLPPPHTVHTPTAHRGGHHPILYTYLLLTEGGCHHPILYTYLLLTEGGCHHPILYTHLLPTEGGTTPYCTHTYCPQRRPPPHTVHTPTAHRGGHHPILYTHLLPTEGAATPYCTHVCVALCAGSTVAMTWLRER